MNFIFITEEDPFYVYLFFELFFKKYNIKDVNLKGLVILEPFNKKSTLALAQKMYNLYGPVDFIRVGFKYVVKKVAGKSIRKLAQSYNIDVFDVKNVNDSAFLEKLRQMEIELVISVAAPQKFKSELLEIPKWGCINIHTGRLPKYRGMLPSFWTLLHEEESGAVTIHKMNKDLDDGEIILQKNVKINTDETLDSYIRKTKRLGAEMMLEVIEKIRDNNVDLKPNNTSQATYFSFPTREHVREFRKKGKKLL